MTNEGGTGDGRRGDAGLLADDESNTVVVPEAVSQADQSPAEPKAERVFVLLFQTGDAERGGALTPTSVYLLRRKLDAAITSPPEQTEIDVWLESPGGSAHAAYKLMLLLRSLATRIRVVIPDFAKSAATLMVLGADEIYMDPAAELGPLDAQMEFEEQGIQMSALDMARAVEHLGQTALGMVLTGGAAVVGTTHLSRRETLSNMLNFVASFMQPIISKLDPTMIHRASSELRVATEYGRRLLAMRNVSSEETVSTEGLVQTLVEAFPSHGFIISPEEARELGLPVRPPAEYPFWSEAYFLYRALVEEAGVSVLDIHSEESLRRQVAEVAKGMQR